MSAIRLGDYELVAPIAAGGMAKLYLAHRASDPHHPLAVKVMHPHLAEDWEATRWFVDEALIATRLDHPNIARVHELGEQDGRYFLAMEYVHGASLAEVLGARARHTFDPRVVAYIGAKIARALDAAHELKDDLGVPMNVIHRDISPQNVLLGHDGAVKLIDFGVVKAEGRAQRTRQGEVRGKLRYMAPEQATGEPLDRRADLFALGVVLWETCLRRRLHGELDTIAMLAAVREPSVPRLSSLRADVPPSMDRAVSWATAATLEERPNTAAELAALLEEAAAGVEPSAVTDLLLRRLGGPLVTRGRKFPPPIAQALELSALESAYERLRADSIGPSSASNVLSARQPGDAPRSMGARRRDSSAGATSRVRPLVYTAALVAIVAGALAFAHWLLSP